MTVNLTENGIEPCRHAFCIACIRYRMRKAGHTICILCSKPASKVVISSAPMEASTARNPNHETEAGSSAQVPIEIQLPSLVKMAALPLRKSPVNTEDLNQRSVEELLVRYDTDETQCRFVIAQMLLRK